MPVPLTDAWTVTKRMNILLIFQYHMKDQLYSMKALADKVVEKPTFINDGRCKCFLPVLSCIPLMGVIGCPTSANASQRYRAVIAKRCRSRICALAELFVFLTVNRCDGLLLGKVLAPHLLSPPVDHQYRSSVKLTTCCYQYAARPPLESNS